MPSDTEIGNLALSHIGVSTEIQNLETDQSEEASALRRFYTPALEELERDFAWPFTTVLGAALGLVAEDPNDEWAYSYRYPSDCKMFRKILSGTRNDTRQSRVPYRIGRDTTGLLIFADKEDAECEYAIYEDDPQRFPPDFVMAFSLLLAAYIAPRLTAGDPFKLGERAYKLYLMSKPKAQGNALNEEQPEEEPSSEFIRAREQKGDCYASSKVGKKGYRWGKSGKLYRGKGAKGKAERQARAIYSTGWRGK